MNWLNSKLRDIVTVFMGNSFDPPNSGRKLRLEEIRMAMLEELGFDAPEFAPTSRRIQFAPDLQTLWYLRGDLMAVLAAKEGETAASRRIQTISAMFDGLLPRGLSTRNSPLMELERSSSSY